MSDAVPVTVVVPVYRDLGDVQACLASVLRHAPAQATSASLVVVEDGSPEPDLVAWLESFAAQDHPLPVTLVRNPENLGFVSSANAGIARASGDVVLLNADTVVTAGWLDALAEGAAQPGVASVTPLSNFGSICTVPASVIERFGLAGEHPDIDGAGAFVAANSVARFPEIITGVGFCMYLTRAALDLVGVLDVETFGKGYGEEVDWSIRASAGGMRHLAADRAFVYHRGGGSFGAEGRAAGKARGSALLHERYPTLKEQLRADRDRRPLAVSFAALELGLDVVQPGRGHVLHVLHSPPEELGGTEKHVMALIDGLWGDWDASILYHVPHGWVVRRMVADSAGRPQVREFQFRGGVRKVTSVFYDLAAEAMANALDLFRPDVVHVQNLVGHSLAPLEPLEDFAGGVVWSVRDLYVACPHHWLLTPDLQPCGIPEDLSVCAACLPVTRGLDLGDLEHFRSLIEAHADLVDHWVVASRSAGDYLLRAVAVDEDRVRVIPHGALVDPAGRRTEVDEAAVTAPVLRVAFVGVAWDKKGLQVVNAVADLLAEAGAPVEIHHLGKEKRPLSPHVIAHGRYDNQQLAARLDEAGIAAVFVPAPYAETFGHVVTEAFLAGRPVIGTSYGAVGERVRDHGAGWTVDPEDPAAIAGLLTDLARNRFEVRRASLAALAVPIGTVADTAADYDALYRAPRRTSVPAAWVDPEAERRIRMLQALAAAEREAQLASPAPPRGASSGPDTMRPSGVGDAAAPGVDETEHAAMATPSSGSGPAPHLTRRSDGVVFLVDSTGRRKVRSGLLAAVLQATYGAARAEGDDAYGTKGDVPDLEILRGPSGDAFVVIDGTRRKLRGLPVPRVITAAEVAVAPEGPALDVSGPLLGRVPATPQSGPVAFVKRVARSIRRRLR